MGWSESGTERSGVRGTGTAEVFDSPAVRVLPAVLLRASYLGVVLAVFSLVLFFIAPQRTLSLLSSAGFESLGVHPLLLVPGGIFVLTVAVAVGLSVAHYRNRRYELYSDRVVEYKGIFGSTNEIEYEDLEDVHLTRSTLQRALGVGTVRLNDIDDEDDSRVQEEMRLRYVEEPERVYERLREASGAGGGTPLETAEPVAKAVIPKGVLLGVFFMLFLAVPVGLVLFFGGRYLGIGGGDIGYITLGTLAGIVGLTTYKYYSDYDNRRYEIYSDHVEIETANSYTAVPYEDVGTVEHDRKGDRLGTVSLKAHDGEELGSLMYVENSETLARRIQGFVKDVQSDST